MEETEMQHKFVYIRWFFLRLGMVLFDIFAVNFAYFIALIIRFYVNFEINEWAVRFIPAFRAFAPWYTVCCLVIFGVFKLYPGKDSYTISEVEIQNYFESLRSDFLGAYYGMYFAEIADYYTRENNDERQMLKLLYQTLRAVESPSFDNRLVRAVYEIKSIVVNGEFPGIPTDRSLQDSTVYAVSYIQSSPVEKLYTFTLKEDVLLELIDVAADYMKKIVRHEFKSLEILKTLS